MRKFRMKSAVVAKGAVLAAAFALISVSSHGQGWASSPDEGLTVKDIMLDRLNMDSNRLWEAVSVLSDETVTQAGQPRTEEEWRKLEQAIAGLSAASDLLKREGLRVAPEGQEIADSGNPGALKADAVQSLIAADRPGFDARALALKAIADKMRIAAQGRDLAGILDAGGELDDACSACHQRYWYPSS